MSYNQDRYNTRFVLPSSQTTIFQMSLTSVGTLGSPYAHVSLKRADAAAQMETYLQNLKIGQGWKCGDSIVRSFHVQDEYRFSIEQKVTVYVANIDKLTERWIGKWLTAFSAGSLTLTRCDMVRCWR
jgi:hypothetical protein